MKKLLLLQIIPLLLGLLGCQKKPISQAQDTPDPIVQVEYQFENNTVDEGGSTVEFSYNMGFWGPHSSIKWVKEEAQYFCKSNGYETWSEIHYHNCEKEVSRPQIWCLDRVTCWKP